MTDRGPLFDLNDVLLGHSCRAVLPEYHAMTLHSREEIEELTKEIGINKRSRGVTSTHAPWDRATIVEWFQPL